MKRTRGAARTWRWPLLVGAAIVIATGVFSAPSKTDPALPPAPKFTEPPVVGVWLSDLPAEVTLSSTGPCVVEPRSSEINGYVFLRLEPSRARLAEKGIALGRFKFDCETVLIKPDGKSVLKINNQAYPGSLCLMRAGKQLAVINEVNLETYLTRVVGAEMPPAWLDAALKAQAVAARTYALYSYVKRKGKAWHLRSTTDDQVYVGGGVQHAAWRKRIERMVRATKGETLLHKGGLFPSFFHSTCGGYTESPGNAIGKEGYEFLEGVPCPYCKDSKHTVWTFRIRPDALAAKLKAAGYEVGAPITHMEVHVTGPPAGRILRATWPNGSMDIPMVAFRRVVGRLEVRSGRFTCSLRNGVFIFSGRGLGHGAGMCQYGARTMAKEGSTYRYILKYYYRNTVLKKLY